MDKKSKKNDVKNENEKFPLPIYSEKDDIFRREEEEHLNEDGSSLTPDQEKESILGDDLDVPGAELDDADEVLGEEDEENNYYSLGGDNHEDLEEDNS